MLVNAKEIVNPAKAGKYGILAACPATRDEIACVIEAADEMNSPVILCNNPSMAVAHGLKKGSMTLKEYGETVEYFCTRHPNVPVAMCLDHGYSLETGMEAIRAGFTLIMIDHSMDSLEDNIAALKEFNPIAHAMDCAVEAALGGTEWRDPTPEEILEHMTKPAEMKKLVDETASDSVCVFVGGSHGDHKDGSQVLHYDLIEELRDCSPAWLAMHGCSFVKEERLKESCQHGLSKFNVAGDLAYGSAREVQEVIDKVGNPNATQLALAIRDGYTRRCREMITAFGSDNKIGGND